MMWHSPSSSGSAIMRGRGSQPGSTVHRTREDASAALAHYVKRNWTAEMDDLPPSDEEEMVSQYFSGVLEDYQISETR